MIGKLKDLEERKEWIKDQISHLKKKRNSLDVQIDHLTKEMDDVSRAIGGIENAKNEAAELISKLTDLGYDVTEKMPSEGLLSDLIIDLGGKDNLLHFSSSDLNIIYPIEELGDVYGKTIRIEKDMSDLPVLEHPEVYEYYKEVSNEEETERKLTLLFTDNTSESKDVFCTISGMHVTYHAEELTPVLHLEVRFSKIPPRA